MKPPRCRGGFLLCGVGRGVGFGIRSEEKCNAPQASQSNQRVNDSCKKGKLAAEKESNGIKSKQSDAAPVQSTHNYQNQCNFIKNHDRPPFLFEIKLIMPDFSESIHLAQNQDNFSNAIERKVALLYNNMNS